jgi:hypothetical protein
MLAFLLNGFALDQTDDEIYEATKIATKEMSPDKFFSWVERYVRPDETEVGAGK